MKCILMLPCSSSKAPDSSFWFYWSIKVLSLSTKTRMILSISHDPKLTKIDKTGLWDSQAFHFDLGYDVVVCRLWYSGSEACQQRTKYSSLFSSVLIRLCNTTGDPTQVSLVWIQYFNVQQGTEMQFVDFVNMVIWNPKWVKRFLFLLKQIF